MHSEVALIFPTHALQQMVERDVSEGMVRAILGDYDEEVVRLDGRTEYVRSLGGRPIRVVVEGEDEPYTIVTIITNRRRRRR